MVDIKLNLYSQKFLKKYKYAKSRIQIIHNSFNLASKCIYSIPAYNYRKNFGYPLETLNMFNFINSHFYGSCHEICFFMKYLLSLFKIKSNIIHMNTLNGIRHMGLEVLHKNQKFFFDPTLKIFFFKKKDLNNPLSISQIKKSILKNEKLCTNKKISLARFRNNQINDHYYYKNIISFLKPKLNYLKYFKKCSIVKLDSDDYSYKKKNYKRTQN